ncbi:MAG: TM2 domain-containing protein [Coriobacteriales bacterium]|jgi:TM2 domain-containing membrane protein YozV|nr:TM2 domain-containing protein [Coriobacteriales bacterium]
MIMKEQSKVVTPTQQVQEQAQGLYVESERKSKVFTGLLGIFLGGLGVHRFYLGYKMIGIIQIAVSFVTLGYGALWGIIEGILILAGVAIKTDAKGMPLK